jgi:hypothetical protein
LLQHYLADQDAPGGAAGLTPGQVTGGFGKPAIDAFVQRVEFCNASGGTCRAGRKRGKSGSGGCSVDANTVVDVFWQAENRM